MRPVEKEVFSEVMSILDIVQLVDIEATTPEYNDKHFIDIDYIEKETYDLIGFVRVSASGDARYCLDLTHGSVDAILKGKHNG